MADRDGWLYSLEKTVFHNVISATKMAFFIFCAHCWGWHLCWQLLLCKSVDLDSWPDCILQVVDLCAPLGHCGQSLHWTYQQPASLAQDILQPSWSGSFAAKGKLGTTQLLQPGAVGQRQLQALTVQTPATAFSVEQKVLIISEFEFDSKFSD